MKLSADDRGSRRDLELDERLARLDASTGLKMFLLYFVLYGGFVVVHAAAPSVMNANISGVSLSVWWGMGLIVAAFALSAIYMVLCRANRDKTIAELNRSGLSRLRDAIDPGDGAVR
jgi:uncharacterized membrane protein (DUF485 family)